ncbi:MAG: YtxH domain-containing protein [Anaerolineales bacterium]|nr:MAG: YtxH domain-containing protein [Anaerolineales bacterium]
MDRHSTYYVGDSRTTDRLAFFLLGAALGALVAAVLAILYAPQSGDETRELIVERGRQLGGRARSGGDEFIHRVREATDEWAAKLQAAADDLVAQGRMTAEEARSQVSEMLTRVQG